MDILDQLVGAAKKLPGQIVGGPVDLANLIAGAATGKGLGGLVDKPVGGSEQINNAFGMSNKSGGVAEDMASAVGGLLSPGGIAKGVMLGGMMMPAKFLHGLGRVSEAQRALDAGMSSEAVFKATASGSRGGIFSVPYDKELRANLSDVDAALVGKVERNTEGLVNFQLPGKLKAQLKHDELFNLMPSIGDIRVTPDWTMAPGTASYNPGTKSMRTGPQDSVEDLVSVVLHETDHGVQDKFGMQGGGSTQSFLSDAAGLSAAHRVAKEKYGMTQQRVDALPDSHPKKEIAQQENTEAYRRLVKLNEVKQEAWKHYAGLPGEQDARLTEAIWEENKAGRYPLPTTLMDSRAKPASESLAYPKVDESPEVQSMINAVLTFK